MSALRRAAVRTSLAVAVASGLAGAAAAQLKIEPIGDWDHVLAVKENVAFLIAAAPSTRAARAYCIWRTLLLTGYETALKADPEVEKTGTSKDYACIRLGCKPHGHRHDAELTVFANAPPLADKSRLHGGVSMKLRFAAGEEPVVLFERAKQLQLSRDGNLELVAWSTEWARESAERKQVQAHVMLAASNAFLDRIAARQTVEFELPPWGAMQEGDDEPPHAGRTVAFTLTRMPDALGTLRKHCAQRGN